MISDIAKSPTRVNLAKTKRNQATLKFPYNLVQIFEIIYKCQCI